MSAPIRLAHSKHWYDSVHWRYVAEAQPVELSIICLLYVPKLFAPRCKNGGSSGVANHKRYSKSILANPWTASPDWNGERWQATLMLTDDHDNLYTFYDLQNYSRASLIAFDGKFGHPLVKCCLLMLSLSSPLPQDWQELLHRVVQIIVFEVRDLCSSELTW